MAKLPILGLFNDANAAADAGDGLRSAGVSDNDFDFLTDAPYPEGAFGEREEKHKLYVYPFIGALLGLTSALLLTTMTQVAYPMVTGGKPIISLPPMAVISYEGTMLGAILFTVLGIIFESRLPNLKKGLYDTRITEGYIGVLVNAEQTQHDRVANVLNQAGAVDVKREN
jgi:molybdopterin-containing oxidoreductase family membrane subunit